MSNERDRRGRRVVAFNLRRLRKEAGVTQQDVAERSEIPRQYIAEIETKGVNITIDLLFALADCFPVAPAELLKPIEHSVPLDDEEE